MEQDYIREIDAIREIEYPSLSNTTYMDHGGTTLYSQSLVEQFAKDLKSNLYGNPHSASPSSALSTERVERVRSRVLNFFKADPEHFDVIFVANATAAIKLVMYAFQDAGKEATGDASGFWYGYHKDAHTSLVGGRQLAAGSKCFKSDEEVEDWLANSETPNSTRCGRVDTNQLALFAYPAQSNMNGHRLPLNWTGRIRNSQHASHKNMYTLLDAAAYLTTAQLDLSDAASAPDFTALSFYKIFGLPDLGALIVRKAAGDVLRKTKYFGGGTVDMVIAVDNEWHAKKEHELHDELEDGTLPFHNIIALGAAFDCHARLFGSMTRISAHAAYLGKVLYEKMVSMKHGNGMPLFDIYRHPNSTYGDSKTQAATVAFNARNSQGGYVTKTDFEQLAILHGIQLRTGGVCNPGGLATSLMLEPWQLRRHFAEGMKCGNELDLVGGKPVGVVRVSLGAMSNLTDVTNFIRFAEEVFVEKSAVIAKHAEPQIASAPMSVSTVSISPVQGCRSWLIPSGDSWEVREDGLRWDGEWCIMDTVTGKPLTADACPQLHLLQPQILIEQGLLTISTVRNTSNTADIVREISISLWDSPPTNDAGLYDLSTRLPDPYRSATLKEFFTSLLNRPCTLGRYPGLPFSQSLVSSRKPSDSADYCVQGRCRSSVSAAITIRKYISLSTDLKENSAANIQLGYSRAAGKSWDYIRIGKQYFAKYHSQGHLHQLEHLPNVFNQSISGQNPTIQVGDIIKVISANQVDEDPVLGACIASKSVAPFICPVPSCRKACRSRKARAEHILEHRPGKAATSAETRAVSELSKINPNKNEETRSGFFWHRKAHSTVVVEEIKV